jgi:hypothetical protein
MGSSAPREPHVVQASTSPSRTIDRAHHVVRGRLQEDPIRDNGGEAIGSRIPDDPGSDAVYAGARRPMQRSQLGAKGYVAPRPNGRVCHEPPLRGRHRWHP